MREILHFERAESNFYFLIGFETRPDQSITKEKRSKNFLIATSFSRCHFTDLFIVSQSGIVFERGYFLESTRRMLERRKKEP